MRREEALSTAEQLLRLCPAELQSEVLLAGGRLDLTRFAENRIHQNVSESNLLVSIRLQEGKRAARVGLNGASLDRARAAIASGLDTLRSSPEIPDLLALPGPQSYSPIDSADAATEEVGPEERAESVRRAVEIGKRAGLRCAGYMAVTRGTLTGYTSLVPFCVANSAGLRAYQWHTQADMVFSCETEDSSGWAQSLSHRFADIDEKSLAERAVEKAQRSRTPVGLDARPRTALLEPAAVGELVAYLAWVAFGGLEFLEGRSVFSGHLGETWFPPGTNLWEDPTDPQLRGRFFDDEGMPRRKVPLIRNGTVAGVVHDRRTAALAGTETTGHSLPVPNVTGPAVSALSLEGGEATLEELQSLAGEGVQVTRFWYVNVLDPARGVMTGMTRDGTFEIQGGRIGRGIRNFRFNQSIPDLFKNVVARGRPVRTEYGLFPPLVVRDFGFSSATTF
jgi:predicted Zn-dependent protease